MNFLVVDFNETATYEMSLGGVVLGLGYDLTECSWDDSPVFLAARNTYHGVGLATSGLAVSKDSPVVAVKDALDEEKSTLLIDHTLSGIRCKHIIE